MFKFNILLIVSLIVFSLPTLSHSQTRIFTFAAHSHGDYASHMHQVVIENFDPNTFNPADYSNPHDHDSDHSSVGKKSEGTHSHNLEHSHGEYPSHTHSGTHAHENPGETHSDPHDVDNSHTHVGKKIVIDPVKKTVTFDAHQHDDYVWHTHSSKSYTGNTADVGNPHDHDNDHSNVSRIPPEPPEGSTPGTPKETPGGATEGTGATGDGQGGIGSGPGGTEGGPGGPPDGNPEPQQQGGASGPQETQSAAPPTQSPLQKLRVTEYMVRGWSVGVGALPQWIELYNPNTEAINLKGYTFQYATRRFANHPYTIHTLALASAEDDTDGFVIAARSIAILATQSISTRDFSGIEATQVYNLNIENVLARGWILTDADGKEVHRLGRAAFSALTDPATPVHQNGRRVSYQVYKSESPSEPYYYGGSKDIGSPGFYKQPPPAAPSKSKRKQVGTWARLKQTP